MKSIVLGSVKVILLSTALACAGTVYAQDHPEQRHYDDKAHHDSHDWNDNEDKAYRRYLEEHHRKYHEFAKANKKEQNDYWNWRHSHPDGH